MVATFPTDGGAPFDVLGGQAAGWYTSVGPVLLTTDAGSTGAAQIGLIDGGQFMQLIDPTTLQLIPGDTFLAMAVNHGGGNFNGDVFVSVLDRCGHKRVRIFDPQTGYLQASYIFQDTSANVPAHFEMLGTVAPSFVTMAVALEPPSGDSIDPRVNAISQMVINTTAAPDAPCP
jgi:hypothetical protein